MSETRTMRIAVSRPTLARLVKYTESGHLDLAVDEAADETGVSYIRLTPETYDRIQSHATDARDYYTSLVPVDQPPPPSPTDEDVLNYVLDLAELDAEERGAS